MLVRHILKNIVYELISGSLETNISDIVYDSRNVKKESLFVALNGSHLDGHSYVKEAINKGANCVVVEQDIDTYEDITIIKVKNTREILAYLSKNYFSDPTSKLITIGITGTKGKTTSSWMIKKMLDNSNKSCGIIGTMGVFYNDVYYPLDNTTPESYEVYKYMREMVNNGIEYVVMEVSSQALKFNRVEGICFDYGIFTNLTKDHIGDNEHDSLDEYIYCKSLLFKRCKVGIFNIDDSAYLKMIENSNCKIYTFGKNKFSDFIINNVKLLTKDNMLGISLDVKGLINDNFIVNTPGDFSAYNAVCAIAIAYYLKIDKEVMKKSLEHIKIKGRVEQVKISNLYMVILDYAHNGMSMKSLLATIKKYNPKRIVSLFGCGGNRSKDRRYDMGEISGNYADFSIITADNSRYEDVQSIIDDILVGISKTKGEYITILDREEAIKYSIINAKEGDIILILGKGHEEYQDIKGVKYPFNERTIINDIVKEINM